MHWFCAVAAVIGIGTARADDFAVEAGQPKTMSAAESAIYYNSVHINDDLTIDGVDRGLTNSASIVIGASATHPVAVTVTNGARWVVKSAQTMTFDGKGGTIVVSSPTATDFTTWGSQVPLPIGTVYPNALGTVGYMTDVKISSGATADGGVMDIARLLPNGTVAFMKLENPNPDVAARILFEGGTYWVQNSSANRFVVANNARIILESVGGNPISICSLAQNYTLFTGAGTLETRGDGDFVMQHYRNATDDTNHRIIALSRDSDGEIAWGHKGRTLLKGNAHWKIWADNILPYGSDTGPIVMSCPYEIKTTHVPSMLDLNGKTVRVNGIVREGAYSNYSMVTNSASGTAKLIVGTDGVDGVLNGLFSAGIEIEKVGGGKLVISNATVNGAMTLKAGSVKFVGENSFSTPVVVEDGVVLESGGQNPNDIVRRSVGGDYTLIGVSSAAVPQITTGSSGNCSIVAEGVARAEMTFTGLDSLLGRARLHVDACVETSITYEAESTWVSTNGLRGVSRWRNVNSQNLYFKNFSLTGQWSESAGCYVRYVNAYPTVQDYTVNGVTRPYVDMGELYGDVNTAENAYNGSGFSTSPTAAAMVGNNFVAATSTLLGMEYHVVFGDAHPNPTNSNRMALMGHDTTLGSWMGPDYIPGRRGAGGKLFAQSDALATPFRDGRIWADNVMTNSTYTPDWGDVHVYTVIPTNAFMGATPSDYGRCYMIGADTYTRYGGARYGEMLIYSGATNTAADRARVDAYLMRKWIGQGPGAEMAFETVTLTNGATLAMSCPAYSDVGTGYRIGTLKGDGSLSVGEKDSLYVENLSFAFPDRSRCESISTDAPLTLADAGTVTITLPGGWIPRSGVYTLFSAPNAVNIEVLDSWTVSSPANCVRIQRVGNALVAEVTSGFMVIVR